jgi:hypothetical protein
MTLVRTTLFTLSLLLMQIGPAYADFLAPVGDAASSAGQSGGGKSAEYENTAADDDIQGESHSNFVNSIVLLLVAFAAVGVITTCGGEAYNIPSLLIFLISSIIYVVGEIFTLFSHKKGTKQRLAIHRSGDVDKQVESLTKGRDESSETAKYLKKKANLTRIAAIGYAVSAVVAAVEAIMETYTPGQFTLKSTDAGCAVGKEDAPAETTVPSKSVAPVEGGGGIHPTVPGRGGMNLAPEMLFRIFDSTETAPLAFKKLILNSTSDLDAYFVFKEYQDFHSGKSQSPSLRDYEILKKEFNHPLSQSLFTVQIDQHQKMGFKDLLIPYLENFGHLLFPPAHAFLGGQFGPLVGIAGGALIAWLAGEKVMKPLVLKTMATPITRIITFGIVSALAFIVTNINQKSSDKFQQQADDFQKLIDKLMEIDAAKTFDELQTVTPLLGAPVAASIETLSLCFKGGANSLETDKNCDCQKTNTCKKALVPNLNALSAQFAIPGQVKLATSKLVNAQKELNNGNLEGANLIGAGLLGQEAAFKKLTDDSKNKVIENLAKNNKEPINFDLAEKKLENKFKGIASKVVKDAGGPPAFNGSALSALAPLVPETDRSSPEKIIDSFNKAQAVSGDGVVKAGKGEGADFLKNLFKEDNEEGKKDAAATKDLTAEEIQAQASMNSLLNSNSALSNEHADLFETITYRYKKSAYPKLLEEIPTDSPKRLPAVQATP